MTLMMKCKSKTPYHSSLLRWQIALNKLRLLANLLLEYRPMGTSLSLVLGDVHEVLCTSFVGCPLLFLLLSSPTHNQLIKQTIVWFTYIVHGSSIRLSDMPSYANIFTPTDQHLSLLALCYGILFYVNSSALSFTTYHVRLQFFFILFV